jgi:putative sterol carrier protein
MVYKRFQIWYFHIAGIFFDLGRHILMTYEELIKKVKAAYAKADASAVTEHVAVQFNVTGEGEGALYLEVTDGKIDIQPFEYYDRHAIVTTNAKALVDIATGKINITEAYNKGILYVDGDLGKASLLEKIVPKKSAAKKTTEKKTTAKKTTKKTTPAKKTVEENAEAPAPKKRGRKPNAVKAAEAAAKTEATQAAVVKPEAPKAEAPKTEAPKTEAPKKRGRKPKTAK